MGPTACSARRGLCAGVAILACSPALTAASAPAAPAGPAWMISSVSSPTHFAPGDSAGDETYIVTATNSGEEPTNGTTISVADELPVAGGVTLHEAAIKGKDAFSGAELTCTPSPLQCSYSGIVVPGD